MIRFASEGNFVAPGIFLVPLHPNHKISVAKKSCGVARSKMTTEETNLTPPPLRLTDLPWLVLVTIAEYLDFRDLTAFGHTCKTIYREAIGLLCVGFEEELEIHPFHRRRGEKSSRSGWQLRPTMESTSGHFDPPISSC